MTLPMQPKANPRAVDAAIFDMGGVMVAGASPLSALAQFPGADPAVLIPILVGPAHDTDDHPWHRIERGELSMADGLALTQVALADAGIVGIEGHGPMRVEFTVNEAMHRLVVDLRAAGVATALCTNNARELRPKWWPLLAWSELFDVIVDSHEVGIRKPNPAIYRMTAERLGVPCDRAAFLDDMTYNVDGATAVGMVGVHVDGDGSDAIAAVRDLVWRA
jgi:putative hydrolase of the HAD superfamily